MAIVHFTFKKEQIPAGAVNVREGKEQTSNGEVPIWTYESHNGLCIADREMNGYDDSDFYMLVWNHEKGEPEEIMFATTRGWSYPSMASYVDATPEVLALHDAHVRKVQKEMSIARDKAQAAKVAFGKQVKVVRGRKVPQGTIAEVFWTGPDKFASRFNPRPALRVGLRLLDGSKVFTSESNVEVINPELYRKEI